MVFTRLCVGIGRICGTLRNGVLQPGYSGIRPKILANGAPGQDFVVQGVSAHGVPGLVNLFGIESPGLTSAIALADYVRDLALLA